MEFSSYEIEKLKPLGFNFSKIGNNLFSNRVLEKTIDTNHYELISKKEYGSFIYEKFHFYYDDETGACEDNLCKKESFDSIEDLIKYLV